jgi:hypothetical protein
MIPEVLLLVKQVRPRTSQVYDFRTSIAVLLESRALKAVERVRDTLTTTDDTLVLVVSEAALIADAHKGGRADVGIADWTFAVTFIAETADGNAGLLAAHNKIAGEC